MTEAFSGPWDVATDQYGLKVVGPDGNTICRVYTGDELHPSEREMATAKLIANAPAIRRGLTQSQLDALITAQWSTDYNQPLYPAARQFARAVLAAAGVNPAILADAPSPA